MLDLTILAAAAEAAHGAAEHHEAPTAWLLTPGGWVAASMLFVFALMLWLKVPAIVAGMLDKQIADIRKQLDDAAKLRAEAEALKAEYEKKLGDAAKDAEAMRAAAGEEAKLIVAKAKSDATALIERRGKSAEEKIAAAKDAEAMRAAAGEEAKLIVAKAKSDATALIERRGKSAEEKIAAAERNAVAELRAKAAQAATQAARSLIADGHDAKADKALVDQAIAGI